MHDLIKDSSNIFLNYNYLDIYIKSLVI